MSPARARARATLRRPLPPMEAKNAEALPEGAGWQYEPKWDGFRCVAFRDGDSVHLQSKALKPLGRYFPDVVEGVAAVGGGPFVLDGEIAVPVGGGLSFDALLQRIHPAKSRVERLAAETPALYVVFDLLADGAESYLDRTLSERRALLERFAAKRFPRGGLLRLSPRTTSLAQAKRWLAGGAGALDGVVAKRLDLPYRSGERAMTKVKRIRTADCVAGGFRYLEGTSALGSILLGLYDDEGLLHHVGFTSGFPAAERPALARRLERLVSPPGFTGHAPGGPNRWTGGAEKEWHPLKPRLVCEVRWDHWSDGRFRHGTRFLRWRPDKAPKQCTFEQVASPGRAGLALLRASGR